MLFGAKEQARAERAPGDARPADGAPGVRRAALQVIPWVALAAAVLLFRARRRPDAGAAVETRIARLEPGRGRSARAPSQIPPRGWRDILWRAWVEFNQDRIMTVAGGVTYFGVLALFPGLAAFVSLYGMFANFHDAVNQIEAMAVIVPHDAVVFIGAQMIKISQTRPSSLSLAFVISFLLSLWSANSGVTAFLNGLNVAYGEREKRTFLKLLLHSLAFTVGGLVMLLVFVFAVVALPLELPFLHQLGPWIRVLRWPGLLAVMMLALSVVYRYGPSRAHARWQWVTWGSLAAAVLWVGASLAFSVYVSRLAHLDRTYGSFGAAAGAMIWLWMSIVIVLLGAELNAEIEHQTAVDSTTGAPLPLGKRGAVMADTIGRSVRRRHGRLQGRRERKRES